MVVTLLEAIQYPPRRNWISLKTESPKWRDIKCAVTRLNRDEWPYVWLHTEPPPDDDMPNNMLCVMGGRGEYALTYYSDGDETEYFDPSRKKDAELLRIWESDQGSERFPRNLCNDLKLTHEIVKHFVKTGQLDDQHQWQTN
ncbi:MAG: Imm1 family immunity protein [Planctomycetota bacterium]